MKKVKQVWVIEREDGHIFAAHHNTRKGALFVIKGQEYNAHPVKFVRAEPKARAAKLTQHSSCDGCEAISDDHLSYCCDLCYPLALIAGDISPAVPCPKPLSKAALEGSKKYEGGK